MARESAAVRALPDADSCEQLDEAIDAALTALQRELDTSRQGALLVFIDRIAENDRALVMQVAREAMGLSARRKKRTKD